MLNCWKAKEKKYNFKKNFFPFLNNASPYPYWHFFIFFLYRTDSRRNSTSICISSSSHYWNFYYYVLTVILISKKVQDLPFSQLLIIFFFFLEYFFLFYFKIIKKFKKIYNNRPKKKKKWAISCLFALINQMISQLSDIKVFSLKFYKSCENFWVNCKGTIYPKWKYLLPSMTHKERPHIYFFPLSLHGTRGWSFSFGLISWYFASLVLSRWSLVSFSSIQKYKLKEREQ